MFKKMAADDERKQDFFSVFLSLQFCSGIIAVLGMVGFIICFQNSSDIKVLLISIITINELLKKTTYDSLLAIFQAKNQVKKTQTVVLIQSILGFILIILILSYIQQIEVLALIYLIQTIIGILITLTFIKKSDIKSIIYFNRNIMKQYWKYTKPLIFASVCALLFTNLGPILIEKFAGKEELGLFVIAKKFNLIILTISSSIININFSNLSKFASKNKKKLMNQYTRKVTRYVSLISVPLVGLVIIFVNELTSILIGSTFAQSAELTLYFMIPVLLVTYSRTIGSVLRSIENTVAISKIVIFTRILGFFLFFIFLPKEFIGVKMFGLGAKGLIFVHIITGLITISLSIYYNYKYAQVVFYFRVFIHITAAMTIGYVILNIKYLIVNTYLSISVFSFSYLFLYVAVLFIVKELKKTDIIYIKNLIKPNKIISYQ